MYCDEPISRATTQTKLAIEKKKKIVKPFPEANQVAQSGPPGTAIAGVSRDQSVRARKAYHTLSPVQRPLPPQSVGRNWAVSHRPNPCRLIQDKRWADNEPIFDHITGPGAIDQSRFTNSSFASDIL